MSNVHTVQIPGLEPEQPSTTAASSSDNNNTRESSGSMTPAAVAAARDGESQSGPTNMDLFQSYPSQDDRSGGDNNNANRNDDDNSNDFFNEMVNTGQEDDGGSVSEFLNTGDMDFEPSDKQEGDQNNMTEEQQRRD